MIEAVIVDDEIKALQSLSWELTNFSDEIWANTENILIKGRMVEFT